MIERWVGRKGRIGRRSYEGWQMKLELFDLEKGQIPGITISVLQSSKGVRVQREQSL